MNRIQVLDCTLRDGGYVNSWNFGKENIQYIVDGLQAAKIDYIECGYLNDCADEMETDKTLFHSDRQISRTISYMGQTENLVAMIDFGNYDVLGLPDRKDSCLFGIRLAFHKHDRNKIESCCRQITDKGYQLFLQPMLTMNYADEELLELIRFVNRIKPYAFYIVDSFGSLKKNDLQRMLYLVDHNMEPKIILGFHSHNNLQLAYSNAQLVTQMQTTRRIIVDASIFGMGRGAGNLNTELFVEYLNDYYDGSYCIKPLLRVMDETLCGIYSENYWGYSLAHYISAVYNCHPNYATYLSGKNSLWSDDIESVISKIDVMHKEHYDEAYIEKMYLSYLSQQREENTQAEELSGIFTGEKILMIGPGRSAIEQREKISQLIRKERPVTVSINCVYEWLGKDLDYLFVSNKRRFEKIPGELYRKMILTTNIDCAEAAYMVSYYTLLNEQEDVKDNSGMMFLKLMCLLRASKVYIAGIDGFSYDMEQNYFKEEMKFVLNRERMERLNAGMRAIVETYRKKMDIEFLTTPKFFMEEL